MNLKQMLQENKNNVKITNEIVLKQLKDLYNLTKDLKTIEDYVKFEKENQRTMDVVEVNYDRVDINEDYDNIECVRYEIYCNLWYIYFYSDGRVAFDLEDNETEEVLFDSVDTSIEEIMTL